MDWYWSHMDTVDEMRERGLLTAAKEYKKILDSTKRSYQR
jgi:hypothetical protein